MEWKEFQKLSVKFGKAMPIKIPKPPPMLLMKVNWSVLGIWVMFKTRKRI